MKDVIYSADVRFRRPKHHEALLLQMKEEAGFPFLRDSLLFAAALGRHLSRREPFSETGEHIRYETMTEPNHAMALVNVLAVSEHPDDPEILDTSRIADRIRIFEEYANGGLSYIQEEVNTRRIPIDALLLAIVADALTEEVEQQEPPRDLLIGL